jgi:hypothetical protein
MRWKGNRSIDFPPALFDSRLFFSVMNHLHRSLEIHFAILLCGLLHGPSAQTERTTELVHQENIGACLNPLGMLVDSRFFYRVPLSRDTGILWKTTKLDAGFFNEWSPGDEMPGLCVTIEPVAVFSVLAKAGLYENYRQLGFGYRPLKGRAGPYHDTVLAHIRQESRLATRFSLAPSLKFKVGRLIIADNFSVNRIDFLSTEGYYYEIRTALPHAAHDWDCGNDVLLLYERSRRILLGVNHNLVYVRGTGLRQQKLGGMAIVTGSTRRVSTLFCLIIAGAYLESGLRRGTPYIVALCGFETPCALERK